MLTQQARSQIHSSNSESNLVQMLSALAETAKAEERTVIKVMTWEKQ